MTATKQKTWLEEEEEMMPQPHVIRNMTPRGTVDHEDDLVAVNDVYENRFRFFWLTWAWVVMGFQSAVMMIVTIGMAAGRTDMLYAGLAHVICTAVAVGAIAGLALVYRWVLFPNSRWVPALVLKQRVDRPDQMA